MKNGSGSQDEHRNTALARSTFLTQRTWRSAGVAALLVAGIMVWYGVEMDFREFGTVFLLVYWGIFLLSLLVAFYMVLLDIRYIRLGYLQEERDLYLDTLGNEELRQALREQGQGADPDSPDNTSPD